MVLGDAVRLTQATVNLLNNAAKYTPGGGRIELVTSVRGAEVEIRIKDNGKGIDPTMLEKIFDLFVQIDPLAGDTMGGLGVGLALVRRVAELHGGSIQARSDGIGRGSEFIMRLPLSIQQLKVISASAPPAESPLPRLRVLVVDDNHDVADTLDLLLRSMGQYVTTAYDGPSAINLAKTFEPDLVFLDIGMPHMSGYEVARAICSCGLKPAPELVAITGWGQEADKQRADEAGFKHHFVKPISEERLREVILQLGTRAASA
jgi:CheY-like chemotaxis protein